LQGSCPDIWCSNLPPGKVMFHSPEVLGSHVESCVGPCWCWETPLARHPGARVDGKGLVPQVRPGSSASLVNAVSGSVRFDWGRRCVPLTRDLRIPCWHNWLLSCRRMRIDPYLSPCTKVKSKWIKELHIKPETLKLIEEKVGKSLEDMGTGEKFLNRTAMACAVRSRIDKWDLMKLQSFCKAKDTINKTKRPPTDWERIFTYPKSDRGLISNIYKELKKVDFQKIK